MEDLIRKIYMNEDISQILDRIISDIYISGPVSTDYMEVLSLIACFHSEFILKRMSSILSVLSLNYKDSVEPQSLVDMVFKAYKDTIQEQTGRNYTPMQADIVLNAKNKQYVSFSAPTSTGKSFVFHDFIRNYLHDVVVVVPSRALINEYYSRLYEEIPDKDINILTFVDKINIDKCRRSILVVTPERCRELFRLKDKFNVDLFLFDEAQISGEKNIRGLYFDSIVRRCKNTFPKAKYIFAHPFVSNPEAQFKKNGFDLHVSFYKSYQQRNVGQIFYCRKKDRKFALFGINKDLMGKRIIPVTTDPISETLQKGGCILVYLSKAKILRGDFYDEFRDYIRLCTPIENDEISLFITKLKDLTGGQTEPSTYYFSRFIAQLKRGIVVHHGSLPLKVRLLLEQFLKKGLCRICFATSTLEQGINMPFDLVYLDRIDASKPLGVKNLIGRAGRSTTEFRFDYGIVVINHSSMERFRSTVNTDIKLNNQSELDIKEVGNDDFEDFKKSIKEGTFNDNFNLTESELSTLNGKIVDVSVNHLLTLMFRNSKLISTKDLLCNGRRIQIESAFVQIYKNYLGRILADGEQSIIRTAVYIMLLRFSGATFKQVCKARYDYIAKVKQRRKAERNGIYFRSKANFSNRYQDIPNSKIYNAPLYSFNNSVEEVDYDIVMYDTYDFIDKLIGFKLSDIFYAAFYTYYQRHGSQMALLGAKFVKYGTANDRYIMMQRYGLDFQDIKNLDAYIDQIDEHCVTVSERFYGLPNDMKKPLLRFL
jgi:hypothetical protein